MRRKRNSILLRYRVSISLNDVDADQLIANAKAEEYIAPLFTSPLPFRKKNHIIIVGAGPAGIILCASASGTGCVRHNNRTG